jgi:cell division protein FtsW (lipid II flippase)
LGITGHYTQVRSAKILGFIIKGLVMIHALQWVISWGNALGLLPVMGQPMTWLSSGNSHLIFVALFLLLASLAGIHVIDSTKLNPELNHG